MIFLYAMSPERLFQNSKTHQRKICLAVTSIARSFPLYTLHVMNPRETLLTAITLEKLALHKKTERLYIIHTRTRLVRLFKQFRCPCLATAFAW